MTQAVVVASLVDDEESDGVTAPVVASFVNNNKVNDDMDNKNNDQQKRIHTAAAASRTGSSHPRNKNDEDDEPVAATEEEEEPAEEGERTAKKEPTAVKEEEVAKEVEEEPAAEAEEAVVELVTDHNELLQLGIVSHVPIVSNTIPLEMWRKYAKTFSQVSPTNLTFEGDNEYPLYRNIMDEPNFPFEDILLKTEIGLAMKHHFSLSSLNEIRLDDAFCVHYDIQQADTTGAKHMDPSDITVNICLDKTDNCRGSYVLFHGKQPLPASMTRMIHNQRRNDTTTSSEYPNDDDEHDTSSNRHHDDKQLSSPSPSKFRFLVNQEPGFATLHYGHHPHETTRLERGGHRTNLILTYCYTDKRVGRNNNDVTLRSCYNV